MVDRSVSLQRWRNTRVTKIDEMVDITMRWLSIGVGKGWQLGGLVTKMDGL